ncbi:MAG TPA: hypothetical protein EYP98_07225, partial [Planctomycetes bacterium]|nr:hypothetical protein [Planctomycetota bacterium]
MAAATVPVGTSEVRLAQMEQRTQRKLQEPLLQRTIAKKFPGKGALAAAVMSFARDAWSLRSFNQAVGEVLAEIRGTPWRSTEEESSGEEDDDDVLSVSAHYDGVGQGPFARSDIDIVIVAQSHEEAAGIIEATLRKVTARYRNYCVYETPCSLQIIGDFPQRHVQIITVLNQSMDEYFLFVDMDCTAMAFDGKHLYGCPRSYMALNTGYNIVPQEMLENRSDTPRRLHKYNARGFASLIPGELTARAKTLLWQAEEIRGGLRYLDIDWFGDDSDAMVDSICANTGRLYSETN